MTLTSTGLERALFTQPEVDALMRVEFERAQRFNYSITCLLIQVDRLPRVHELHGWEVANAVLARVVELAQRLTREGELLGYLVEDRLLAIFPHTNAKAAPALAQGLLADARELSFRSARGPLRITLSIGLSHNDGGHELSWPTLKEVAAEGLAVADAGGGDRWCQTELYSLCERRRAARGGGTAQVVDGLSEIARDLGYREKLEEMVARDGDLQRAVTELVEEIMARAQREAQSEAQAALSAEPASDPATGPASDPGREQAYLEEIDLLRRRVAKLTRSLGVNESQLARLLEGRAVDEGVASIYSQIQGVDERDERAELKRALMESIFQANLDLQRELG